MRSTTCRPAIAMIRTCVARSATASSAAASTRTSPLAVDGAVLADSAAAGGPRRGRCGLGRA